MPAAPRVVGSWGLLGGRPPSPELPAGLHSRVGHRLSVAPEHRLRGGRQPQVSVSRSGVPPQ